MTDQDLIPRITLCLAHNSATDEDIDNIDEETQLKETQSKETQLNNMQKNEIKTSHKQASIELRTLNFNISDSDTESVKLVSKIKIFILIEALVRKNQILDNNNYYYYYYSSDKGASGSRLDTYLTKSGFN